jgi:hypothetical protein
MIVKNEAASINATLASMRADLDFWTIVDTGSTDGTQAGFGSCLSPMCMFSVCSFTCTLHHTSL